MLLPLPITKHGSFLYYLERIYFALLILLILIFTECNVNGVSGDGTVKGTCPETYQVCASNGMCEGTNYYHCQSQN